MLLHGIQAVAFDAVGTLLHPHPPAGMAYAEVGHRLGSRYSLAEITPRFAAAYAREEERDLADSLRTSEVRERQRWQTIVAEVLDDVVDPARCFADLYAHFSRPGAWRCEGGIESVLDALGARGIRVTMASNMDHRLRDVVAGFPELRRLDPLVISAEVGWRKPAREFYMALCRGLDLAADKVLYVGDDLVNDYDGAAAAGLRPLLFDPRRRYTSFAGRRLERLTGLLDAA
jgi:putative hydrolase of the HAD superfamily